MVEYSEDAQAIRDELPSDDNRDLYRPFNARTSFKKVDPRPGQATLFESITSDGEALRKLREIRARAQKEKQAS